MGDSNMDIYKDLDLFGNEIPPEKKYSLKDGSSITVSRLRNADRETKLDAMETWFYGNYEDPVNLPYNSEEGGYLFIHGGPFEPRDEVENEFAGIVDDDIIDALVGDLEDIAHEWSGRSDQDFDDYLFDAISNSPDPYVSFRDQIANIKRLSQLPVPAPQQSHYSKLLYLNVVITLEAYLSETFVGKVSSDPTLLRQFFKTDKRVGSQKIRLMDVFEYADKPIDKFREHFASYSWHRLSSVGSMFAKTMSVKFPKSDELENAIRIRHDIAHRNGKTDKGKEHTIVQKDIDNLVGVVEKFVGEIEGQVNPSPF